MSEKSIVVGYGRQGFDAIALLAAIRTLDLSRFDGFVYGSGFEAQPNLLQRIAELLPIIGNAPAVVTAIKSPAGFFAALQQLDIRHPKVGGTLSVDANATDVYLKKFAGGSGGAHIKIASADSRDCPDSYYYQQKIEGRSISLLFIANAREIEVIGFNEQWLNPSDATPFRYGGAVSYVALSKDVQQQLISGADKLTKMFGLVGLNSLDAIVREKVTQGMVDNDIADGEQAFVLEINPRLSATVDLYTHTELDLFWRHVQACYNQQYIEYKHDVSQSKLHCKAHAIVYAKADIEVPAMVAWPDWVVDNPARSARLLKIPAGEPVCTVVAYSADAEAATRLAQARVEIITSLLQ